MIIAMSLLVLITYLFIGSIFAFAAYEEFGETSTSILVLFTWPCWLIATILYGITLPIKKCINKFWPKIKKWNVRRIEKRERNRIYLITKKEYQILRNKLGIARKRYVFMKETLGPNNRLTQKAEKEYRKLRARFDHSVYRWNNKIITKNTRRILKR